MNSDNWMDALAALRASMPEQTQDSGSDCEPAPDSQPGTKARLDVFFERKGRAGKTATIITGFDDDGEAASVAAYLKKALGTGGSSRGGEILIQGDRRDDVIRLLAARGYRTRRSN